MWFTLYNKRSYNILTFSELTIPFSLRFLSTSASCDQLNYNSASDTSERYYTADGIDEEGEGRSREEELVSRLQVRTVSVSSGLNCIDFLTYQGANNCEGLFLQIFGINWVCIEIYCKSPMVVCSVHLYWNLGSVCRVMGLIKFIFTSISKNNLHISVVLFLFSHVILFRFFTAFCL